MRNIYYKFRLVLGLFGLIGLCGCAPVTTHHETRAALGSQVGKQAGPSPAEAKWISENCPLGVPKKMAGIDFGFTKVISREGYVLEHSAKDKIPLWVCEKVTTAQVNGALNRPKPEPFAPDPALKGAQRAELKDYRRSGYDRGHQAPSADQSVSKQLQAETYFLSNMCPQRGELNQRIWKALEETVRDMATEHETVFVVTGPIFYDEAEDDKKTADRLVEHEVIGDGVAVPTHFYKIIEWQTQNGKWQGAAVVMKNQKTPFTRPYHFNNYVKSISWIEEHTGFNFNPDLAGNETDSVERHANLIWN